MTKQTLSPKPKDKLTRVINPRCTNPVTFKRGGQEVTKPCRKLLIGKFTLPCEWKCDRCKNMNYVK